MEDILVGCLLGGAVGDALGLPYEGLSPRRAARLLGPPDRYRLCFRRGMVSDDTEHACLVAQALIAARGDVEVFRRHLAWGLRGWLLLLPAGAGLATLRAILRLWVGVSPERSGVFSAGNGPAMRAAILGASISSTPQLRAFVRASSRLTHTDPKAERGALAIALAAQHAAQRQTLSPPAYLAELTDLLSDATDALLPRVADAVRSASLGQTTEAFAASLGLERGVTGYMYDTVPVVLHAWFSHPTDLQAAITATIRCGGDADSTAALVGGIVGAAVGRAGIPALWCSDLIEWPRSVAWIERLGATLAQLPHAPPNLKPPRLSLLAVAARNSFFLLVVLFHGFRRLLPPYGS